MKTFFTFAKLICIAAILLALGHGSDLIAQEKTQPSKPAQDDDVVRVSTTLVQTDVMVFDKQGKFVEGLRPGQFELKVNGKSVPISFLELVTTGSAEEKAQLEAARRAQPATVMGEKPPVTITPPAGRSIFIFLDDFHLDAESFLRTRKTLLNTIDKEITANDRALITAASGQLGVQHLTTDKAALKAVVDRLAPRAGIRQGIERPVMSEYAAIAINRGDRQILDYYVEQIKKVEPADSREVLEERVKSRAQSIIDQAAPLASNTLTSLESFLRELSSVPGRKLVFFLSDGFVIENEQSMSYSRLSGATREAARAGVVIYSMNTQGLAAGGPDVSEGTGFDSRLSRSVYSANQAAQDVIYTLAADTGGRALLNNNDLNSGVRSALEETSKYYLLAWRPLPELATGKDLKRIELVVSGRPDLKVKTRKDLAEAVSNSLVASNTAPGPVSAPAARVELLKALNSEIPQRGVPTSLVVVYRNVGAASFALTASMQFPSSALTFADLNGKQIAAVEIAGVVLDQGGKQVSSFNKTIGIGTDSTLIDPTRKLVFYNYDLNLEPGSYQLRLGIRDSKSGKIGSAAQTIEIPDIATGKLALSSLMLNEQLEADDEDTPSEKTGARKGVAQRFARGSHLRFLTYVYNARPAADNDNEPDLNVEVRILRGNQPFLSPALREMVIESKPDTKSFPFAAEIPLEGVPAGEYMLQVTVTDVTTKATATQQTAIVVE